MCPPEAAAGLGGARGGLVRCWRRGGGLAHSGWPGREYCRWLAARQAGRLVAGGWWQARPGQGWRQAAGGGRQVGAGVRFSAAERGVAWPARAGVD